MNFLWVFEEATYEQPSSLTKLYSQEMMYWSLINLWKDAVGSTGVTLPHTTCILQRCEKLFFHCDLHSREQLSSLLKNYNSYYSDQENLQLTYNQVRI